MTVYLSARNMLSLVLTSFASSQSSSSSSQSVGVPPSLVELSAGLWSDNIKSELGMDGTGGSYGVVTATASFSRSLSLAGSEDMAFCLPFPLLDI